MARQTNIFNKIPSDAFENLGLGAGVLLDDFDPNAPTAEDDSILCATTGGFTFSDTPTFKDMAEDIDNAPKNMLEYMEIDDRTIQLTGTAVSITPKLLNRLMLTVSGEAAEVFIPANRLSSDMFRDVWLVCEYGKNEGFVAIHLMNTICTSGLSLTTEDNGKTKASFTLTAHYSSEAQSTVPYEVYITQSGDMSST